MRIWRAEMPSGYGVFTSGVIERVMDALAERGARPENPGNYPTPPHDPILGPKLRDLPLNGDMLFGCLSEEQLFQWFASPMVRVQMNRHGVLFALYECPSDHVVTGETQCIFNRRMAKAVLRKPFPVRPSGRFREIAGVAHV